MLAIEALRRQTGALPTSLDQLVERRILPAAPIDPFADKPFGYSAEKRRFWSVGPDGKNDGSDEATKDEVNRMFVWRL
jgi:hypothetical protein